MNTRLTLAPDEDLLRDFKRDKRISWDEYEVRFEGLMKARSIEKQLDPSSFERKTVLLCSEDTPEYCHRRLVAEHLQRAWGNIEIVHL